MTKHKKQEIVSGIVMSIILMAIILFTLSSGALDGAIDHSLGVVYQDGISEMVGVE